MSILCLPRPVIPCAHWHAEGVSWISRPSYRSMHKMPGKIILHMPCCRGRKDRGSQSCTVFHDVSVGHEHLHCKPPYWFRQRYTEYSLNFRKKKSSTSGAQLLIPSEMPSLGLQEFPSFSSSLQTKMRQKSIIN